jgi:hypothetical protein
VDFVEAAALGVGAALVRVAGATLAAAAHQAAGKGTTRHEQICPHSSTPVAGPL